MPGENSKAPPPPPPPPGEGAPFIVTNVKPRLVEISIHRIGPGQSVEIPPEHVAAVRKSAVFRGGILVEGKPVLPPSTPIDISKLDLSKARKLIAVEDDVSVLTAWIDAEKRPEIVAALQERVRAL